MSQHITASTSATKSFDGIHNLVKNIDKLLNFPIKVGDALEVVTPYITASGLIIKPGNVCVVSEKSIYIRTTYNDQYNVRITYDVYFKLSKNDLPPGSKSNNRIVEEVEFDVNVTKDGYITSLYSGNLSCFKHSLCDLFEE